MNVKEKKYNNVKKNYLYNLIYEIFSLITPLLVAPYVARTLSSAGVGQYSFSYSIVTYFTILASFGFSRYAQREIAQNESDLKEQSIIFWEIIIERLLTTVISFLLFFLLLNLEFLNSSYEILLEILSINIIAQSLDITFFFQGNEEFDVIVFKSIIIKSLGVATIFLFVRESGDVWKYTLCQSCMVLASNVVLWAYLSKRLVRVSLFELNIKRHFGPSLKLFIPTIAISVYTMLDKTLIGLMIPGVNENGNRIADIENGYYEQAEKLIRMAMTLITSLGTVMIPRNSKLIASGNKDQFKENICKALQFVFLLGVPMTFGIAAISFNLTPWFFGSGYEKVPYLMMMLSPLILIIGLSNVFGIQYLLPQKKDSFFSIAITCGAVLNFLLNMILIPLYQSYGACIATVLAECVITFLMMFFSRKDICFSSVLLSSWKYIVSGIIMFLVVFYTQIRMQSSITNTILLVFEGALCYIITMVVLREKIVVIYFRKFTKYMQKFRMR